MRTQPASPLGASHRSAFTMIEIALSLAIIGFALVAIIAILPAGMSVQKDNRQETIINQDASIFMNALRNGERGMDDLTNYVLSITNYQSELRPDGRVVPPTPKNIFGYTYTDVFPPGLQRYRLTNGYNIVGLLGTPRKVLLPNGGFFSNYVVAHVRSISGSAMEKSPQTNETVKEFALTYKLIPSLVPFGTNYIDRSWTNWADSSIAGDTNLITLRSNAMVVARNTEENLHDIRLTFRWPILPDGSSGSGRLVFRTTAAGHYSRDTNGPMTNMNLFFIHPRTYLPHRPS